MSNPQNINSEAVDQIHSATIQIDKLQIGTIILVETEDVIYELTVFAPEHSVVSVDTSDKRFMEQPLVTISTPIAWGNSMRMVLNGAVLFSKKVNGATVKGDGWRYDVFD